MRWMALFVLGACALFTGCSPANIIISSVPEGAEIYLNGNYAGITPKRFLFPVGERQRVRLTMPDKLTQEGDVWIVRRRRYHHQLFQSARFQGSRFIAFMRSQDEWDAYKKAAEEREENRAKALARSKAEAFERAFAVSTFFGLTLEEPFTKEAKAKLGAPAKERPYDENVLSYYESPRSFVPFHQMLVEHSPADGTIKSLRFYGFYDSDEKAEKYLKALRVALGKDYRFKNYRNSFYVQGEPNGRVFRIILTTFKPEKNNDLVVINNNRLRVYQTNAGPNQTVLVLDVLGYSYKVDEATIKSTRRGIRGDLKPVDKKKE